MPDGAFFAVSQLHSNLLAYTWAPPAFRARVFFAHTRPLAANITGRWRLIDAHTGITIAFLARLWLGWRAIPIIIIKPFMRLHEIVDREVILAVIQPRAAPDDLLELDHRIDRTHQHDVAHVARINSGRKFLRRGEDGRDALLVVLEVAQELLAALAVVGSHAHAIVRIGAGALHLVDQVAHRQRVRLVGAEHQRLLALVDRLHEQLHAIFFARLDLDDAVEVLLLVQLACLDLALDQLIVRGIAVFVQRGGVLLHPDRREEAAVGALLQ